jgi:methoxymalonate biosynthesis acyl carrier protein
MNDERDTIRAFVARHTGGAAITDDLDIFAGGLVSSLFAVQIVMWVERTFELPVHSEDLDMGNIRSIDAIATFVARKRAAALHS